MGGRTSGNVPEAPTSPKGSLAACSQHPAPARPGRASGTGTPPRPGRVARVAACVSDADEGRQQRTCSGNAGGSSKLLLTYWWKKKKKRSWWLGSRCSRLLRGGRYQRTMSVAERGGRLTLKITESSQLALRRTQSCGRIDVRVYNSTIELCRGRCAKLSL